MKCDEFDLLLDRGDPLAVSEEARQHAAGCGRCHALAAALAGAREGAVPSSALAKAQQAAARGLAPVRPIGGTSMAVAGTAVALACLALAGVWMMGTHGWDARLPWQRTVSYAGAFGVLALALTAAMRERVPGSGMAAPWRFIVASVAALLWAGPFVLYEFRPEPRFWWHGLGCHTAGLLIGCTAGAVLWLVMRRGYSLSPQRAGWFAGMTAGSLAFIVQETYCPVVESAHVALWHGGVTAVLGAIAWIAGPLLFRRD